MNFSRSSSVILFLFFFLTCKSQSIQAEQPEPDQKLIWKELFNKNPKYLAQGFRLPVGKKNANNYYVAQGFKIRNKRFGNNYHLGEDWNGTGGGNTDYGDPVYSAANGLVVFADFGGPGWGDVIRVIHMIQKNNKEIFIETIYGHVSKMYVRPGNFVTKGEKIAEIGDANGLYLAHLHFELRDDPEMELGGGYADQTKGFLDPREFIKKNSVKNK